MTFFPSLKFLMTDSGWLASLRAKYFFIKKELKNNVVKNLNLYRIAQFQDLEIGVFLEGNR
ncbi:MAG: hypothetical protein ACTSXN_13445 [Promethearchaeota archaeon]